MPIAFVQGVNNFAAGVTSLTSTAMTTTVGNLFVVGYGSEGSNTVSSVTDSYTNTFSDSLTYAQAGSTGERMGEKYVASLPSGKAGAGHTATLTMSANSVVDISVTEISGQDTSAPYEATGALAGAISNPGTVTTGSATSAGNALGTVRGWSNAGGQTLSSPFTQISSVTNIVTGYASFTAGSRTTTVTDPGFVQIAAFFTLWKEAAAGGVTGPLVGFRHLGGGGVLVGGRLAFSAQDNRRAA